MPEAGCPVPRLWLPGSPGSVLGVECHLSVLLVESTDAFPPLACSAHRSAQGFLGLFHWPIYRVLLYFSQLSLSPSSRVDFWSLFASWPTPLQKAHLPLHPQTVDTTSTQCGGGCCPGSLPVVQGGPQAGSLPSGASVLDHLCPACENTCFISVCPVFQLFIAKKPLMRNTRSIDYLVATVGVQGGRRGTDFSEYTRSHS